ncbi:hypothetical protein [Aromatoleum aromaticum]|uniref:hypothetical protein n=1 Tax=Aromatoleum aromaticum TaxID=551760 RepID=UPI0014592254|nr:hypothetical protein [Aromatoleum aromaticum]
MGLTTWENAPHGRILKTDVVIAKNLSRSRRIAGISAGSTSAPAMIRANPGAAVEHRDPRDSGIDSVTGKTRQPAH